MFPTTSGVDFAGNVVVPEFPPVPVAATPADIVLLPLREEHLRDRVHQQALRVPDQDPQPAVHRVMHSLPSDKSSVIAQLKLRISELQSRFTSGGGECIPVPDSAGSSFATMSSAPPPPAGVDLPPGLAALPQVQSHDHGQDPPPPPDKMFPTTERDRERCFKGPVSENERIMLDALHAQDAHPHDAGPPPDGDPGDSSSSSSSSDDDGARKRKKKKRKKGSKGPYKVKNGEIPAGRCAGTQPSLSADLRR